MYIQFYISDLNRRIENSLRFGVVSRIYLIGFPFVRTPAALYIQTSSELDHTFSNVFSAEGKSAESRDVGRVPQECWGNVVGPLPVFVGVFAIRVAFSRVVWMGFHLEITEFHVCGKWCVVVVGKLRLCGIFLIRSEMLFAGFLWEFLLNARRKIWVDWILICLVEEWFFYIYVYWNYCKYNIFDWFIN